MLKEISIFIKQRLFFVNFILVKTWNEDRQWYKESYFLEVKLVDREDVGLFEGWEDAVDWGVFAFGLDEDLL